MNDNIRDDSRTPEAPEAPDRHHGGDRAAPASIAPVNPAPGGGTGGCTPDAPTAGQSEPPARAEVSRFRLATLRARLVQMGVAFDPSTDEGTLRRMVRAAQGQGAGAPANGVSPVTPADPVAPPSAEMRRAMARHLRERQRLAAADVPDVPDVADAPDVQDARNKGRRPCGRGRS